jgi:hypothetical protein
MTEIPALDEVRHWSGGERASVMLVIPTVMMLRRTIAITNRLSGLEIGRVPIRGERLLVYPVAPSDSAMISMDRL